ncbi:DUF4157 domain-containing protein [Phenylobacterium sp.]|uniref:eCIS core domain-containing protein n=1 Tax=Phenylobacterium sp. TaxID=1871053 RepID=UPI00272F406B|nr:DUF4157 domain-containing protein [Phenylobacterium sp.]MDP1874509.1 DUF4157 domain-containing protein [Phenylobacterium sp.]MDP3488760.1 DUF4157 domain-containing protein [Phenylobacterium sp.]
MRSQRRWPPSCVTSLILAAGLALGACSGEPNEASLRPPAEWRASIEQSARNVAGQAREASEEALRRSPAVTGPALVQAIRFSRAQALAQTPEAMPDQVRTALAPYFADEILESARWTTAGQDLGLGSILARWYYEEGAVTLKDVIVFSDAKVAQNVWLWAHELAHMEQYRRLGTERFAARYVSDWRELEAQANRRAFAITADIRARRAARPSPVSAVVDTITDMLDLSEPDTQAEPDEAEAVEPPIPSAGMDAAAPET